MALIQLIIFRSLWYQNPHFRGSYSYRSIETEKWNVSPLDLARPLVNQKGKEVVLFAGEASHPYYYSTVHGAIETGFREADRIIHSHKLVYRQFQSSVHLFQLVSKFFFNLLWWAVSLRYSMKTLVTFIGKSSLKTFKCIKLFKVHVKQVILFIT